MKGPSHSFSDTASTLSFAMANGFPVFSKVQAKGPARIGHSYAWSYSSGASVKARAAA